MLSVAISASAADLGRMTFECHDGSKHSVAAENLAITFDGGALCVNNGVQSLSFPLSELKRFYFGTTSGLASVAVVSELDVFTLDGAFVGHYSSMDLCLGSLSSGVYVVKTEVETFKLMVK